MTGAYERPDGSFAGGAMRLHPTAPAALPAAWDLAWLLGEHGEALNVAPDVIGCARSCGGGGWRA